MRIIIFSGKGGSGVSTVAAATAVAAARAGRRTLAFGLGPGLGQALGAELAGGVTRLGEGLDVVEGRRGSGDEFRDWLERLLEWRGMEVELAEDLTGLPGMHHVGRLLELSAWAASGEYEAIVVDGAPLGQFLDLPGSLDAAGRWLGRLFAPRQANVFEPFVRMFAGDYATAGDDVMEGGRELLGRLAGLRDVFTDPEVTTVRVVLTPERGSVEAAAEAVSVLSLFSYNLDALIVNRVLPEAVADGFFRAARDEQREAAGEIARLAAPVPVVVVELRPSSPRGFDGLEGLASEVHAGRDPLAVWHRGPEHTVSQGPGRCVMSVALPLARREEISLEQAEDGVIVQVDGRRCVLPLPREARYYESASWAYEDGVLRVTFEE